MPLESRKKRVALRVNALLALVQVSSPRPPPPYEPQA
jgi:hypothetical protein